MVTVLAVLNEAFLPSPRKNWAFHSEGKWSDIQQAEWRLQKMDHQQLRHGKHPDKPIFRESHWSQCRLRGVWRGWKGELMNYERKRKRWRSEFSSWVMGESRCECFHADGDPGVLQKGGDVKKECKCEEKEEVLLSRKREVLLNVLLSHTIQEVNLLLCVCVCVRLRHESARRRKF